MRCDKTLALVIVVCKYGDEIIENGESKKENNGKMTASWKREYHRHSKLKERVP